MPKKNVREWAYSRLVNSAEALFAERGLHGVSLRAISAAAGHSNNFAVQYHFQSKEHLLRAIYDRRLEQMEQLRQAALDAKAARGERPTARELLRFYLQPFSELTDREGRCTHARFLMHYISDQTAWRHLSGGGLAYRASLDCPTNAILTRLAALLPGSSRDELHQRVWEGARMYVASVVVRENELLLGRAVMGKAQHLESALDLCMKMIGAADAGSAETAHPHPLAGAA